MNIKLYRFASLAVASALALGASPVLAQSQSAKTPAAGTSGTAKPLPSTDPGKRRGKGDRIMTKDELRACMSLKDKNDRTRTDTERRRAALDKERAELASAPNSGGAASAALDEKLAAAKEVEARYAVHAKAIGDWNARMAEFQANSSTIRNPERAHAALVKEQQALKATEDQLQAERKTKIAAYDAAVKEANDKAAQGGDRNSDWNKRNEELASAEQALLDSRRKWASECGDRRFREEDETAIRAGK